MNLPGSIARADIVRIVTETGRTADGVVTDVHPSGVMLAVNHDGITRAVRIDQAELIRKASTE